MFNIIKDPGKFEGEPIYVPFFWDIVLNGLYDDLIVHDNDNTIIYRFYLTDLDHIKHNFPEDSYMIDLWVDDLGFVHSDLSYN